MSNLGGWAICEGLFNWIRKNIPEGSTILEFGSGRGTIELTKYYTVYSVEQHSNWVGLADKSNYIYAPIKNGWYDTDILFSKLPENYDLILVDGPRGTGNRSGLGSQWQNFNIDVPIIMDDTNRVNERNFALDSSRKLNKDIEFIRGNRKEFAVLR
jgi:hypothetical protein